MHDVMGIINLNENTQLLQEVTQHRPLAAVPFAGRYRLIDFVLSSMVNSGIENVGILVQTKYRSLMDHLRSGKEWDLARKWDGLFILPPSQTQQYLHHGGSDIENLGDNLDYIRCSRQKYILIAGGRMVCNINYRKAFQLHQQLQADITMLYKEQAQDGLTERTVITCDDAGWVTDIAINPKPNIRGKSSMEMFIMGKELLVDLITDCRSRGGTDLLKDGLIRNLSNLKIYGYQYKGYLAQIDSIYSYYHHNMELLKPDKWQELFFKSGLIYTKVKDAAPAKYKESAVVANAMVANGCMIEGQVHNSLLFRGVRVHQGACVKDSIIMQKCEIGANALLENVICDKDVCITAGKRIKGERQYPLVIAKGTVI